MLCRTRNKIRIPTPVIDANIVEVHKIHKKCKIVANIEARQF